MAPSRESDVACETELRRQKMPSEVAGLAQQQKVERYCKDGPGGRRDGTEADLPLSRVPACKGALHRATSPHSIASPDPRPPRPEWA